VNDFYIISFATKDSPYVDLLSNYLEKSLKKFNLKYSLSIIEGKRTWYQNTALKPKFILESLEKLNSDVVWIDADATIEKEPILFYNIEKNIDIALHRLHWNIWYNYPNSKITELLTGTIYIRNSNKMKELSQEWYEKSVKTNTWEQKILASILEKRKDINIYELPLEYCYINTLPGGREPYIKCDNVVIRHFQASREWKRKLHIQNLLNKRKK